MPLCACVSPLSSEPEPLERWGAHVASLLSMASCKRLARENALPFYILLWPWWYKKLGVVALSAFCAWGQEGLGIDVVTCVGRFVQGCIGRGGGGGVGRTPPLPMVPPAEWYQKKIDACLNPLAPKARKQNCQSIPTVNRVGVRGGEGGGGAPPMVVSHSNTSLGSCACVRKLGEWPFVCAIRTF